MPSFWNNTFWPSKRVLITGGYGFLGQRLASLLKHEGAKVFTPGKKNLNLLFPRRIEDFFLQNRSSYGKQAFDIIFHLAARVGGIGDVRSNPYPYISDNLQMTVNLLDAMACVRDTTTKVVFAGSVCAYPLKVDMPMREEDLWNGKPEPTNGPYGVAKRTVQTLAEAFTAQYGNSTAYALLANMFGPGDRYDSDTSHAIPSIILKIHNAKLKGHDRLEFWGSGKPTRDFLFVDDAAEALARMAIKIDTPDPINIGSGTETSIEEVVSTIKYFMGWKGTYHWNTSFPDGQPRRVLDITRARDLLEWQPTTFFRSGIELTIEDYMHRLGRIIELNI
jgi:GDP-L-fucose synthase